MLRRRLAHPDARHVGHGAGQARLNLLGGDLPVSSHQDTRMRTFAICLSLFLLSSVATGATLSFDCRFTMEATPNGLAKQASPLELRFVTDTEKAKTYLMANNGSSEVQAIPNSSGVSFFEVTGTGNVMVTSITKSGEAVHSRNSIMGERLIPSQYYGKCIVK